MHEKELDGCIKTWFFTRVRSICWILPFNEQSQAHGLGTHMGWGTLFMGRHWERGGCLFPYSPFPIPHFDFMWKSAIPWPKVSWLMDLLKTTKGQVSHLESLQSLEVVFVCGHILWPYSILIWYKLHPCTEKPVNHFGKFQP